MKVDIPQQIYFQTYWAAIIESRLLILLILFLSKSILIEFFVKVLADKFTSWQIFPY